MLSEQPQKSSRSGGNGNCVLVAFRDGAVEVTDSKNPAAPALQFTPAEWEAFLLGAKDGEFDIASP